ncbi:uncharacterized protein LOC122256602 [Penaeus japonicus]|uniref:uncharacterized protein LOC122256602 n=1 Tax=Penaeus japonicus TaxID=27405 RepID=UPI001C70D5DE|nr:uncharacterized protein LOC122256602 [Penaeus japonicus]
MDKNSVTPPSECHALHSCNSNASSSSSWPPTPLPSSSSPDPNATTSDPPTFNDKFYVDDSLLASVVVLAIFSLVVGLGAGFGLLLRDVMKGIRRKKKQKSRLTCGRVLLCSYASAGILHSLVYTPVLLAALIRNNAYESANVWACNIGWLAWAWSWAVQLVGGIMITFERYVAVTSPISGQLSCRLGLLMAGISWVFGGVVGVLVAGGLPYSLLQIACSPVGQEGHGSDEDFMVAMVYVVAPGGFLAYVLVVCFWALMASAVREQGKVSVTTGVKEMGVGECGRPRCPCHGEVELVTIARTSGAFCPTCASSGWWADIPQPQNKLQWLTRCPVSYSGRFFNQALLCSIGQWTAPLLVGAASSTAEQQQALAKANTPKGDEDGSKGVSSSTVPSTPLDEEDTFTLGGVYIGSLESHIRTHQAFCSGMNVRSQGCQTGELEVSPPVIEWRIQMSTEELSRASPTLEHVGTQCSFAGEGEWPRLPRSPSQRSACQVLQVAGEVCVRDARARLAGRTRVEAGRSLPAVLLVLVQMLLWLPLPIAALTLFFSSSPDPSWAWRVLLVILSVTNLSPALGSATYLVVAR